MPLSRRQHRCAVRIFGRDDGAGQRRERRVKAGIPLRGGSVQRRQIAFPRADDRVSQRFGQRCDVAEERPVRRVLGRDEGGERGGFNLQEGPRGIAGVLQVLELGVGDVVQQLLASFAQPHRIEFAFLMPGLLLGVDGKRCANRIGRRSRGSQSRQIAKEQFSKAVKRERL